MSKTPVQVARTTSAASPSLAAAALVQRKPSADPRRPEIDLHQLLQQSAHGHHFARLRVGPAGDPAHVSRAARLGTSGSGGPLPHLASIQRSFGEHDVSGVSAHLGAAASQAALAMGAQAFATGNHVAFAGTPDLHTAAHEAAHVVQQRAGISLPGGVGREGDAHERQADAVADRVAAGQPAGDLLGAPATGASSAGASSAGAPATGAAVQRRKLRRNVEYRPYLNSWDITLSAKVAFGSMDEEDVANIRALRADSNARLPYPEDNRHAIWQEMDPVRTSERAPTGATVAGNVGKYTLAAGLTGATYYGGAQAISSTTASVGLETGLSGAGGGMAGGMAGLLSLGDSAATFATELRRHREAARYQDDASTALARQGMATAGTNMASSAAGVGASLANVSAIGQHGRQGVMGFSNLAGGGSFVGNTAATAGSALGVIGGAISMGQGGYGIYSAQTAINRLQAISPATLGVKGIEWRNFIIGRQKVRRNVNVLKTVGGALGVVGGALLLASNPVGWALGLAAAGIGAGIALWKIGSKLRDLWKRRKVRNAQTDRQGFMDELTRVQNIDRDAGGAPYIPNVGGAGVDEHTRYLQTRREADVVMRQASGKARIAGELADAYKDAHSADHQDAVRIVGALEITRDQVLSPSGQELIESRISALTGV